MSSFLLRPVIDPALALADMLAENIGLQHNFGVVRHELDSEHAILKRMLDTDPSLPISLLASLLSIARRKREDNATFAAIKQSYEDSSARLESIQARESLLMAAASASGGPTFFGHSRRWQSLRIERAAAEEEFRNVRQHLAMMRERLAKLDVIEKQAWGAISNSSIRPRSSRSIRPPSRASDRTAGHSSCSNLDTDPGRPTSTSTVRTSEDRKIIVSPTRFHQPSRNTRLSDLGRA